MSSLWFGWFHVSVIVGIHAEIFQKVCHSHQSMIFFDRQTNFGTEINLLWIDCHCCWCKILSGYWIEKIYDISIKKKKKAADKRRVISKDFYLNLQFVKTDIIMVLGNSQWWINENVCALEKQKIRREREKKTIRPARPHRKERIHAKCERAKRVSWVCKQSMMNTLFFLSLGNLVSRLCLTFYIWLFRLIMQTKCA